MSDSHHPTPRPDCWIITHKDTTHEDGQRSTTTQSSCSTADMIQIHTKTCTLTGVVYQCTHHDRVLTCRGPEPGEHVLYVVTPKMIAREYSIATTKNRPHRNNSRSVQSNTYWNTLGFERTPMSRLSSTQRVVNRHENRDVTAA